MSGTDKKNKYQEFKESVHLYLHADNPFANALGYVEKYTKVDRQYIALAIIVLLVLYIMIGWGAALVVNLIGFVYPAYASYGVCHSGHIFYSLYFENRV
jgi:receptor expression-enhancing protein 5/6